MDFDSMGRVGSKRTWLRSIVATTKFPPHRPADCCLFTMAPADTQISRCFGSSPANSGMIGESSTVLDFLDFGRTPSAFPLTVFFQQLFTSILQGFGIFR